MLYSAFHSVDKELNTAHSLNLSALSLSIPCFVVLRSCRFPTFRPDVIDLCSWLGYAHWLTLTHAPTLTYLLLPGIRRWGESDQNSPSSSGWSNSVFDFQLFFKDGCLRCRNWHHLQRHYQQQPQHSHYQNRYHHPNFIIQWSFFKVCKKQNQSIRSIK